MLDYEEHRSYYSQLPKSRELEAAVEIADRMVQNKKVRLIVEEEAVKDEVGESTRPQKKRVDRKYRD